MQAAPMKSSQLMICCVALLTGACGSDPEQVVPQAPSITLTPASVSPSGPGTRTAVTADVRGIGPNPAIAWTSLAPDAVIVDSVRDAGRTAYLRFEQRRSTIVLVTARGTQTLVDTLFVTVLAARDSE
jgi:hypothetical protein